MTAVIVTGMVSVLVAVLALAGGPRVQPLLEAPVGGVASGRGRPAGPLPRGRDSGGAVPVTPQPLDVGSVAVRLLALGGCTGAGWALLGGPLGLGVGGAAGIAAWIGLSHLEPPSARHRRVHMQARYPLVLDLLAGVVEAGAPMRQAVRQVADVIGAPDREPLDRVLTACGVGSTDAEAWLGLSEDPLWGGIAGELARSIESGTASARILRSHAEQARRLRATTLLTRARAVGVKSALPLMVCFLPAFMLVGVVPIIGGLVKTGLT